MFSAGYQSIATLTPKASERPTTVTAVAMQDGDADADQRQQQIRPAIRPEGACRGLEQVEIAHREQQQEH